MQIICPKCNFKRDVDSSKLPANTSHATCPKCFEKFSIHSEKASYEQENTSNSNSTSHELHEQTQEERRQRAHSIYKEESERAQKEDELYEAKEKKSSQSQNSAYSEENIQYTTMVPWEIPGNNPSLLHKFYHTLLRIFTSAPLFFATMLRSYPMHRALIFYIIVGMIQFIVKMFVFQFSSTELVADTPELQMLYDVLTDPMTLVIGIAISPIILLIQAHLVSMIFFITLKLIQPQSANYALCVRIVVYASAVGIVGIVPMIGDYISIPWMVFNFLLACRYTLQMSMLRACLTVLAFALFSFGLLFMVLPIF